MRDSGGMARSGEVLEVPGLGVRIEFRRTTEETGGELVEIDVVGRPKGLITAPHVHPAQTERHELIEGSMRMKTGPLERVLAPGDVVETAPGVEHSHRSAGDGPMRVRVQIRPAGAFEPWLEALAAIDRDGQLLPAAGRGRSLPPGSCSTSRARRTARFRRWPSSRRQPAQSCARMRPSLRGAGRRARAGPGRRSAACLCRRGDRWP